jgi:hypothetical protein
MRHIVQLSDQKFLMTPEQLAALVNVLADCDIVSSVYMGNNMPEPQRWKEMVIPPKMDDLKFGVMDTPRYEMLKLIGTLHLEEKASK